MKKQYIKPEMKELEIACSGNLMAASNPQGFESDGFLDGEFNGGAALAPRRNFDIWADDEAID